jgi:hypothetical protein
MWSLRSTRRQIVMMKFAPERIMWLIGWKDTGLRRLKYPRVTSVPLDIPSVPLDNEFQKMFLLYL